MQHIPVLTNEVIKALKIKKNGTYIDCTFGSGGHSREILKNLGDFGKLYSIDQDPQSLITGKKIIDPRFQIFLDKFSNIKKHLKNINYFKKIDGMLLDLGISSCQLNEKNRGFSFMKNGPLDMRMDYNHGISVSQWLQKATQKKIEWVIKNFGEERYAKKISQSIFSQNKKNPIIKTMDLVKIIKKSIPIYNKFKHPATRTFQALRIYINQEVKELKKILSISMDLLKPGARLVIISFHSIEDRIVKNFIKKNSKNIFLPKKLPITEKQIKEKIKHRIKFIKRIKPKKSEIKKNSRARSAILRVSEII